MTENNEEFTASDGLQVRVSPDAAKRVQYKGAHSPGWGNVGKYSGGFSVDSAVGVALAQFYRHREDVRLGRVRSEVDPDYVFYPVEGKPNEVDMLNERTGRSENYARWEAELLDESVVKDYFEANPPAPVLPTEPGLYVNSRAWSKTRTSLVILALGVGGGWTRKDNGEESSSEEALEFATYWAKNGELVRLSAEV